MNMHNRHVSQETNVTVCIDTSVEHRHIRQVPERHADVVGILIACVILIAVIVNPLGDFPVQDDWSYGRTVRELLKTGNYNPLPFTPAPMITNVLWGLLFCLPAGFGFTALRLSTLIASVATLVATYLLVWDLHRVRWVAFLVSLTLAFNPIYCFLSFTFDTDVLFTALAVWSALFFHRYLTTHSRRHLLFGTALSLAATLSRELGLCVPLAFAIALLLKDGLGIVTMRRALSPICLCASAFFLLRCWLAFSGRLPTVLDAKTLELLRAFASVNQLLTLVLGNSYVMLLYMGLFLMPVLVAIVPEHKALGDYAILPRGRVAISLAALSVLAALVGATLRAHYGVSFGNTGPLMPITGDYIVKAGLDPPSLHDDGLNPLAPFPPIFWFSVTAIGAIGGWLLIVRLAGAGERLFTGRMSRGVTLKPSEASVIFVSACGLLYLIPLLVTSILDDRYLVPSIPFLATGCIAVAGQGTATSKKLGRLIAVVLLAHVSVYAVATTRDYMAFNRVRWEAAGDLMRQRHVGPEDIDGGWEFNGWYLYNANDRFDSSHWDPAHPERWRGPWVQRDTYMITRGSVPGYQVVREYSFQHWLPPYKERVLVLQRRTLSGEHELQRTGPK